MKIAIIGYGKMGKQIENLAREKKVEITAIVDDENEWQEKISDIKKADVAIEFSTPETAIENIKKCFELKIPLVTGTTGWHDQFEEIKKECITSNNSLFFASNFNIGMNIFFALNKYIAGNAEFLKDYKISIEETHHTAKLDSPSGTAITLANDLINELSWINKWINKPSDKTDELGISSHREGEVTGTHDVVFESEFDIITLSHSAKNRRGFAHGALISAEWIIGKKGVYSMSDLLKL